MLGLVLTKKTTIGTAEASFHRPDALTSASQQQQSVEGKVGLVTKELKSKIYVWIKTVKKLARFLGHARLKNSQRRD